jgi:hypothetical protein
VHEVGQNGEGAKSYKDKPEQLIHHTPSHATLACTAPQYSLNPPLERPIPAFPQVSRQEASNTSLAIGIKGIPAKINIVLPGPAPLRMLGFGPDRKILQDRVQCRLCIARRTPCGRSLRRRIFEWFERG